MSRVIVIAGAGLVGSLLATLLGQRGERVIVIEKRSDPRQRGFLSGRSINLAISARGLKALRRAGLEERVLARAVPMPGRLIHVGVGGPSFQPYSADGTKCINSVDRSALNLLLMEAASATGRVEFRFDTPLIDLDVPGGAFVVGSPNGGTSTLSGDLLVAADGAYSVARAAMQKREMFDYDQSWLSHGYKELHMSPVASGPHAPWAMTNGGLHIWPRGGSMMIALPNSDGSFTCTLFWPHHGAESFANCASGEAIAARFAAFYPDVPALIPDLAEQFHRNPVGSMVTVKCAPWSLAGRFCLIGDAAHAIVPFFGQGANAGFEDCEALLDAIEANPSDQAAALAEYELRRKCHTDAIGDLAVANFLDMRDHTARLRFRVRKAMDRFLHRIAPRLYIPLYEMVSFSTIPYDDARRRAREQDLWLVAIGAVVVIAAAVAVARCFDCCCCLSC